MKKLTLITLIALLGACGTPQGPTGFNLVFDTQTGKHYFKPAKLIYMPWEQIPKLPGKYVKPGLILSSGMCVA